MVDECRHHADDHHGVGAAETRAGQRGHRDTGGLDLIGEQRLQHGRAGVDRDHFRSHALLLQELAVLHHPYRAIGRTEPGPGKTQPFLSSNLLWLECASDNDSDKKHELCHTRFSLNNGTSAEITAWQKTKSIKIAVRAAVTYIDSNDHQLVYLKSGLLCEPQVYGG